MTTDNPTAEPGALNANSAAAAFAAMLEPPKEDAATETPSEPEAPANQEPPEAQNAEGETPSEEAQPEAEKFTVKIDGKEVEVSLDELKAGYQRQQDYTRKTTEAAETRKAAEAELSKARQQQEALYTQLNRNEAVLQAALEEQAKTDWDALLKADPVEFIRQQHLLQQRQAALNETFRQKQEMERQAQAEQVQRAQVHVKEQQEALLAKLPDWADPEKAKAGKAELREYLMAQGFDEQSVSQIQDHRAVVLSHKAMLYDRLMDKAKAAAKQVQKVPQKVERPGGVESSPLDKRTSAYQRLSKSGRIEDAASVFSQLL